MVGFKLVQDGASVRAAAVLGEAQVMLGVTLAERSCLGQLLQLLACELADSLQHPKAPVRKPHEALLDECLECVELGLDDLLRRLERAAAGEDGEPREQMLLLVGEQVDAPFDRRPQRLLARIGRPSTLEQVEPLSDPFEYLRRGEHARARRRELDGERQVVEPPAEHADVFVRLEP